MRKTFQLFVVFILSLLLVGSSNANMKGISLHDYPKQALLFDLLEIESIIFTKTLFILPEDDFDQVQAAGIINRIGRLPDSILKKAVANDLRIKLFQGNLTDNPTASHLKGVVPRGYTPDKTWDQVPGIGGAKMVLVKIGSSDKGNGHNSVNLEFHELAHSLDRHVYGGIRYDRHFLEIWKSESGLLFPGRKYFLNYPEEYFAESFAMFYIGGIQAKLLQEAAPRTYHFIKMLD
jgi:hypothetical protein